ncbi:MAG: MarR family transcriptional regulator [Nocardioides sp.]|uniref:MarR family winged helix-turn-helix transcriptional regulator n=1 Tax=Nocardioides sp. TaxID=35761 RepID=UPI0039E6693D
MSALEPNTDAYLAREEEPLPAPSADPIEQLAHIVPAMWRTLVRVTRAAQEMPAVESQVSILRKLVASGPMAPAHLADELHLSRPTVSNLLKALVADGLVERTRSATDARSVIVSPTERGRRVLETFRHDRAEVLRDALTELAPAERDAVTGAVPALRQLLRRLEAASR